MKKIIIAIDGYSACGKSTTAKIVAEQLNYVYIDTGAMYRAVTLYFLQNQIDFSQEQNVQKALQNMEICFEYNPQKNGTETYLNRKNVEEEIRKMYVSAQVSEVSKIARVRHAMVAQQQKMGENKGIVMDGRDIGTTVFPQADLKIFMTAEVETRAKRRQAELKSKGEEEPLQSIVENLQHRDLIDTTRQESPLKKAEDAIILDSTHISIEEQTRYVIDLAQRKRTT